MKIIKKIFGVVILISAMTGIEAQDITEVSTTSTPVSCGGVSDGSITIEVTGGIGDLNYSLFKDGEFETASSFIPDLSYTFSGYPKGTDYYIFVSDKYTETDNLFVSATIGGPDTIRITGTATTDINCADVNDGTITVTAIGEDGNLVYTLDGTITDQKNTGIFTDLPAGTYDVIVSHATCPSTDTVTGLFIDIPPPLTITLDSNTPVTCFGGNDGAIEITPSGGTPSGSGTGYTYNWIGPNGFTSTQEDLSGIAAGNYTVEVTDDNGCNTILGPVTVDEPGEILATVTAKTNVTCNGNADGTATITVTGGTPGYTFLWEGQLTGATSTDQNPTGLVPDTYNLTITDVVSCSRVFTGLITITEPDPLAAVFNPANVSCFGADNGTISIDVTGGTTPYGFQWTGPNGFSETIEDISSLEPGNYSLEITDANGCVATYPDQVTITEPTEISVTATSTDISCNGANDGTISIVTSGGTPGYTYAWTGPDGFSSDQPNLASLSPGTYSLTVTDANTCIRVFNNLVTINEPTAIEVTFNSQTNLACFGDSDGSISIGVTGGAPPYSFAWTNSAGTVVSTDEDPTGLPADTYSLVVTDITLCSVSYPDAVVLTEPPQLNATLAKTDVLCSGEGSGTITVNAMGGAPPYAYALFSGGPYNADNVFTGLSKGTYNVYTRDANGCTTNGQVIIEEPEAINYEYSVTGQNLCYGDSSVTISINNVTGGISPYEYSIDGGSNYQADSVFTNIPGGTYPVVVMDANLCEMAILPLTVFQPDSLSIVFYDQDEVTTCYDDITGRIAIQGSGGTGDISYSINGGTAVSVGEFTGLARGSYEVSMIDENLCHKDTTVEILAPDPIMINNISISDVTGCAGDSNGRIEVDASGGTGQIRYALNGGTSKVSGVFNGLTAGEYIITAEDANGCTLDTTVSVDEPLPISITSVTAAPAACKGTSTGALTVEAEGGTPGYFFTLSPALLPTQNTGTISGLPAGDYTVEVEDSEGCGPVPSGTITISEPPALQVDSVNVTHISCNGSNDGKISVYVIGGTAPYAYSIDNEVSYQSDPDFTGLAPGTYDVYVRDANGCSIPAGTYTLNEPPALTLTGIATNVTPCFGDANGTITATASGGWNDYAYSIDGLNYQSTGDYTGLAAGDYTITVRDTGNCTVTADFTILQPDAVTATIVKTDYKDTLLGSITISDPAGGTPPYQFSIDGPAGTFTNNTSYTDLLAGTYEVVVRDANGCMYQETVQILEIQPITMVVLSTDVSCHGLDDGTIEFQPQDAVGVVNYSIDGGNTYMTTPLFENLPGDSTYILDVYDEDGKEYTGTITINEPAPLTVFASVKPANCNAFSETGSVNLTISGGTGMKTVNWSNGSTGKDLTNVVAGTHIYTVADENGCEVTDTANIPAFVIVNADAGKDTTVCAGSSLVLDAVPGDVMLWDPPTFLSNTGVADPVISNITDTIEYTYTSRETGSGFGCYDIDTVRINVLPMYGLEITQDTFALEGQSIQLNTTTEGTFVSYQWIPESGLDQANIPDPVVSIIASTRYILLATNDYGCTESDTVLIELVEDITVYNAFSPNGDFVNEFFEIDNASKYPDIVVQVFNRWGSRIFYSEGYSDAQRWDGTYNGKDVPVGTYYYVVIPRPDATPISGNVTIIR